MNSIEKMINELCPEGVKRVKLGEVCEIKKGVQFNKADMLEDGLYPVINGGILPSGYINDSNESANTITISQGGASAGFVNFLTTDFWLGAHCYAVKPNDIALNRYVFHFIKENESFLQQCQYGAGIPALNKSTVDSLELPLPPLPIQEEIVRILDKCTDLIKNLDEEIALRQKQYEFYRNQLLGEKLEGVERVKLGDVCEIKRGKRLTKKQLSESESYPVYHGGIEPIGYYEEYNREENTVMIINVGASAGTVGYCNRKFWSSDGCFCIGKNESVQPKFLYYFLSNNQLCLQSKVRTAGIPTLDNKVVEDFELQLPPLPIQEEIVRKLDKFNELISSLEEERKLRQKQYEHYREQLLSF